MKRSLAVLAVITASTLASTSTQDQVSFARTLKVGDKAVYTFSHTVEEFKSSVSGVISYSVSKVLPNGRPELKFHMQSIDVSASGGAAANTPVATDRTIVASDLDLPKDFAATLGGTDHFFMLYMWAASTMGKEVKLGTEMPWKTSVAMGAQGTMTVDGTIKVTELVPGKRLRTQISGKLTAAGNQVGTYTNVSVFALPDCTLIEGVADFHVGVKQEIKFTLKK